MRISEERAAEIKKARNLTVSQQVFVDKMAAANIPVAYWFLPFSSFSGSDDIKTAVAAYMGTAESNYSALVEKCQSGKGICFAGNYGVGKTYAICSILKTALLAGKTVYYTSLPEMSTMLTSRDKDAYLSNCIKSEFLAIDEMDSRHYSSSEEAQNFFGSMVEKIIRSRVQNRLPLLIGTNHKSPVLAFSGQHSRVLDSLLSQTCDVVVALGKDYRKK
jgi:DNA replication protein DnaC